MLNTVILSMVDEVHSFMAVFAECCMITYNNSYQYIYIYIYIYIYSWLHRSTGTSSPGCEFSWV